MDRKPREFLAIIVDFFVFLCYNENNKQKLPAQSEKRYGNGTTELRSTETIRVQRLHTGAGPGKSPAATVKSFAKAMTDLDVDGMAKCIVPEMRTDMDEAKAEFSQIKSMVSGFSVKVKDLQDPIYNPEKTGCTLNGTMTVTGTMGGVSITGASGSGSMDMPVTFELEKIDGKWLISDMGGMESLF
jgi:hypothetical protein